MSQAANNLVRKILSRPKNATGLLRPILPVRVSRAIDWRRLRLESSDHVDDELRGRYTDLLFSAPVRAREAQRLLIHIVVEHQSTADHHMPFRMLEYQVGVLRKQKEAGRRYSPVVGVVIFHGKQGWTAARSMNDLYQLPPDIQNEIAPLLPGGTFILHDLSALSDDELMSRAESALVRLFVLTLKHGKAPDLVERLHGFARLLAQVVAASRGIEALAVLVRYMLEVNARTAPGEIARVLGSAAGAEAERVAMTVGQKLVEEGRAKGRAEGRAETLADMVLKVLRRRERPVSAKARATITRCTDLDLLKRWFDEAFTVASAEELSGVKPGRRGRSRRLH